jgi:hypothetical protein
VDKRSCEICKLSEKQRSKLVHKCTHSHLPYLLSVPQSSPRQRRHKYTSIGAEGLSSNGCKMRNELSTENPQMGTGERTVTPEDLA